MKKKKFSIINDIYRFIEQYNSKYSTNINIHTIIQGNKEDTEIINNVSNYLLETFFDYEEENEDNEEDDKNIIQDNNPNNLSDKEEELLEEKELKENYIENSEDEEDNKKESLIFEEFYPKEKIKKRKRNYKEAIGESNELKKMLDNILIKRHHKKENKTKEK